MTVVLKLAINDLRCVVAGSFDCSPGINLFWGANGSGKTSILESLYLLATGKSFRSASHTRSLVRDGHEKCTVFGRLSMDRTTEFAPGRLDIGVQRSRDGERRFKVGGRLESSVAAILEVLPVALLNSDSFSVVNGAPVDRRRFLDWGVFHVEQRFLGQWQRFQRALKQRNALLRRGNNMRGPELEAWELELASASIEVDSMREAYMELLVPEFAAIQQAAWPGGDMVVMRYRRGWDEKAEYLSLLVEHRERDAARGFTGPGAHRADISLRCAAGPAGEILSRGQQKMLVSCLRLAQGEVLRKKTGRRCVYLVDDLPAELDRESRKRFIDLLMGTGCQAFFTAIEPGDFLASVGSGCDARDIKMFHVEHGRIMESVLPSTARRGNT